VEPETPTSVHEEYKPLDINSMSHQDRINFIFDVRRRIQEGEVVSDDEIRNVVRIIRLSRADAASLSSTETFKFSEPNCSACGRDLTGAPKIELAERFLCYRCAKAAYPRVKSDRFSHAKFAYDARKRAFDKAHQEWARDKDAVVMQGRPMLIERFWFWVILGLGLLKAGQSISISLIAPGVLVFFLSPFVAIGVSEYLTKSRFKVFSQKNVEPHFFEREPLEETFRPEMICRESDGTTLKTAHYRTEILERDDYTCQSCGEQKPAEELEVHHVIPKVKGGSDAPTNLITLCIPCHDREDWFGHVRKHPTTI